MEKKKTGKPRKKQETQEVQELKVSVIYHKGDDIQEIARTLTGHEYLAYKLLQLNGYNMNDIPDGAVLTWEI